MRKLAAIVLGMMLGGGGVWFGYNFHVVRAEKEWLCVRKQRAALSDVYCDIRAWGAGDWKEHADLALDLAKHGRGDLVVEPTVRNVLEDLAKPFAPSRRN